MTFSVAYKQNRIPDHQTDFFYAKVSVHQGIYLAQIFYAKLGVRQGDILSPNLFEIFINDLFDNLTDFTDPVYINYLPLNCFMNETLLCCSQLNLLNNK